MRVKEDDAAELVIKDVHREGKLLLLIRILDRAFEHSRQ